MKKIIKILSLVAIFGSLLFYGFKSNAVSPCGVSMGCTGVVSITGIPYGTGTNPLGTVTIGSGLSFVGGTLSAINSGTITAVSVATANGLAGSSSGGTTPTLTLSTTISGILKGNGTAISAATTTGSGDVVLATSPTLTTPNIGSATASGLTLSGITGSAQCLHVDSSGVISGTGADCAIGSGITIGTTAISGGTNGYILYNNAGIIGNLAGPSSAIVGVSDSQNLTNKTYNGLTLTSNATGFTISGGTSSKSLVLDTDITASGLITSSSTNTLTNKRITPRVGTTTSNSATPSINTDNYDNFTIDSQSIDITSLTTNLTGTPTDSQSLSLRIKGNNTNPTTFINSNTVNITSNTVTLNKPTNTQDNDIMFAHIVAYSSGTTVSSAPSGWTSLGKGTSSTVSYFLYYKVASSEGSSYTWTFSSGSEKTAFISTFRGGFNILNPIQVSSNGTYTTNNTTIRAVSMNVTNTNSPIIFFSGSATSSTPPTVPSTFVEELDSCGTYCLSNSLLSKWSGSGATGDMDAIGTLSQVDKHAFAVALNPIVNITYGSSFSAGSYGPSLQTSVNINNGYIINEQFIYDSSLLKWILKNKW